MVAGFAQGITAAQAFVRIGVEDKVSAALAVVTGKLNVFAAQVGKIGASFQKIGLGGGIFGAGLIYGIKKATEESSRATEVNTAYAATFRELTAEAEAFANTLASRFKRDVIDVKDIQRSFFGLFAGQGFDRQFSNQASGIFTTLAYDFSSFFNTTVDDAASRLLSALSNSAEVVQRFGFNVRTASLESAFKDLGINETIESATEAQKILGRVFILLTTSGPEQLNIFGDVARTIDDFANQVRGLESSLTIFMRAIGRPFEKALAPIIGGISRATANAAEWIRENERLVTSIGLSTVAIVTAGAALITFGLGLRIAAFGLGPIVKLLTMPILLFAKLFDVVGFATTALFHLARFGIGIVITAIRIVLPLLGGLTFGFQMLFSSLRVLPPMLFFFARSLVFAFIGSMGLAGAMSAAFRVAFFTMNASMFAAIATLFGFTTRLRTVPSAVGIAARSFNALRAITMTSADSFRSFNSALRLTYATATSGQKLLTGPASLGAMLSSSTAATSKSIQSISSLLSSSTMGAANAIKRILDFLAESSAGATSSLAKLGAFLKASGKVASAGAGAGQKLIGMANPIEGAQVISDFMKSLAEKSKAAKAAAASAVTGLIRVSGASAMAISKPTYAIAFRLRELRSNLNGFSTFVKSLFAGIGRAIYSSFATAFRGVTQLLLIFGLRVQAILRGIAIGTVTFSVAMRTAMMSVVAVVMGVGRVFVQFGIVVGLAFRSPLVTMRLFGATLSIITVQIYAGVMAAMRALTVSLATAALGFVALARTALVSFAQIVSGGIATAATALAPILLKLALIAAVAAAIGTAFYLFRDQIKSAFNSLGSVVSSFASSSFAYVAEFLGAAKTVFFDVFAFAKTEFFKLLDIGMRTFSALQNAITAGDFKLAFNIAFSGAREAFFQFTYDAVVNWEQAIIGFVKGLIELKFWFQRTFTEITGFVSLAFDTMESGRQTAVNSISRGIIESLVAVGAVDAEVMQTLNEDIDRKQKSRAAEITKQTDDAVRKSNEEKQTALGGVDAGVGDFRDNLRRGLYQAQRDVNKFGGEAAAAVAQSVPQMGEMPDVASFMGDLKNQGSSVGEGIKESLVGMDIRSSKGAQTFVDAINNRNGQNDPTVNAINMLNNNLVNVVPGKIGAVFAAELDGNTAVAGLPGQAQN